MDDLYQEFILEQVKHPHKFGQLDQQNIASGQKKWQQDLQNLSCGDGLKVEVILNEQGVIQDLAWTGNGCALSMAGASVIADWSVGKNIKEVQELSLEEILAKLGLKQISHSRIKCVRLLVEALSQIKKQVEHVE